MYKNPSKFAEVSNKFKGYDADLAIVKLVDFLLTPSRRDGIRRFYHG